MLNAPKTPESAEILALEALGWLAGSEDGLGRFLAAAGTDLENLRGITANRDTALAVLEFLLANEDLLLGFCDSAGTRPKAVHTACHALSGA